MVIPVSQNEKDAVADWTYMIRPDACLRNIGHTARADCIRQLAMSISRAFDLIDSIDYNIIEVVPLR